MVRSCTAVRHLDNVLALLLGNYLVSVLACAVAVIMATVTENAMQRTVGGGEAHSPSMERAFQRA